MKKAKFILIVLGVTFFYSCTPKQSDPRAELAETLQVINSKKILQYDLLMELNQMDEIRTSTFKSILDLMSNDTLLGAKYAFYEDTIGVGAFDGKSLYMTIPEEAVVVEDENPHVNQAMGSMMFFISPYTLKNMLPIIINDSTSNITYIEDVEINNTICRKYTIEIVDYVVSPIGEVFEAEGEKKLYHLFTDNKTKLPIKFIDFSSDEDYLSGTFSNFTDLTEIEDAVFNLEPLPEGYIVLSNKEYSKIRKARQKSLLGNLAPDFTLKDLNGEEFQLSALKGSPVMLEFWFPNCGYCIKAVPTINRISSTYESKGLKVMGVEFSEVKLKYITKYIDQNNMTTPTLLNGKETAVDYGISSGPTFVLLDKDHNVVYVKNGLDEEELVAKIEELL